MWHIEVDPIPVDRGGREDNQKQQRAGLFREFPGLKKRLWGARR